MPGAKRPKKLRSPHDRERHLLLARRICELRTKYKTWAEDCGRDGPGRLYCEKVARDLERLLEE